MSNFDLPVFLVTFAGGVATAWALVLASRTAARNRPRMDVLDDDPVSSAATTAWLKLNCGRSPRRSPSLQEFGLANEAANVNRQRRRNSSL